MRIERDFTKWLKDPEQAIEELEIIEREELQAKKDLKEEKLLLNINLSMGV